MRRNTWTCSIQDVWEPVEIRSFREPVKAIACGGKHSMAVSRKGEIFTWGSGSSAQLGLGRITDVYEPTGIVSLNGVFDCAAGDDYSACLVAPIGEGESAVFAEAGSVWTWGSCEAGKLGHEGMSSGTCSTPKRVRLSSPISKLACGTLKKGSRSKERTSNRQILFFKSLFEFIGRSHMVVASPNGDVFTWGAGYYGRLGIGSSANSSVPVGVRKIRNHITHLLFMFVVPVEWMQYTVEIT